MVRETIAVAATLCGTVPALVPLVERGIANTHDGLIHVQLTDDDLEKLEEYRDPAS